MRCKRTILIQFIVEDPITAGVECRWGMKKSQFNFQPISRVGMTSGVSSIVSNFFYFDRRVY